MYYIVNGIRKEYKTKKEVAREKKEDLILCFLALPVACLFFFLFWLLLAIN